MDRKLIATELLKIAGAMISASPLQGELEALNLGGRPFKYLDIGDKFSFKKDGKDALTKIGDRSYRDSKGRKFQTGKDSATFDVK